MLNVAHVDKTFNTGTPLESHVLRSVNMSLHKGDYATIIGGNGAGKSTLMNIVAGTHLPDSGTITIDGHNVTKLPEFKRAAYLGRVFQDPMVGTAASMNIEENLALAYRRGKRRGFRWYISSKERDLYRERLSDLELGLESRLTDKVGLLSGGQRQALALIMATLQEPRVLLLDEHTAALDPKTAPKVLEIGNKIIKKYNLTTMMVTHNMKDAIRHGNRLIMMKAGQIVLDISGGEKKNLTVEHLIARFNQVSDEDFDDDAALLV
ncbi:MAG: ABC transporter ATP-binding protein [Oscillospiraceae bacterium]|nr:ABC transporter ATP-binding protein [Oscillospiraceae bacterium]